MIDLNQQKILFLGDATVTNLEIAKFLQDSGAEVVHTGMTEEHLPTDATAAIIQPAYFRHEAFMDNSPQDIEAAFFQNYEQPTFAMQRVARQMKEKGIPGSLVLLSSVTSLEPHARNNLTGSSLAALEVIVRMAAVDLGPDAIRLNIVAAGWIGPEQSAPLLDQEGKFRHSADIPLPAPGTATDLANACAFLVSPLSRHLTGTILRVDGGYSLTKSAQQTPYV